MELKKKEKVAEMYYDKQIKVILENSFRQILF